LGGVVFRPEALGRRSVLTSSWSAPLECWGPRSLNISRRLTGHSDCASRRSWPCSEGSRPGSAAHAIRNALVRAVDTTFEDSRRSDELLVPQNSQAGRL